MPLPQEVRDAVIALENDGQIRPDDVLNEAMNPESPLHSLFNWDVEAAARAHWLDQARELIKRVKIEITYHEELKVINRYMRDVESSAQEQGYRSVLTIAEERVNETLALELVQARSRLNRALQLAQAREGDLPQNTVGRIENHIATLNATINTL